MAVPIHKLEKFMRESNAIEGELEEGGRGALNPNDIEVAKIASHAALKNQNPTEDILLQMHAKCSQHSGILYKGCYRGCNVRVGTFVPPPFYAVPNLMKDYLEGWETYTTYEAHVFFEKIHPFEDFNGRMGRLLWMWRALQRHDGWYTFSLPFLHRFYYEALASHEKGKGKLPYGLQKNYML